MTEQLIDLNGLHFWLALTAAIVFISPLSNLRYKAIAWGILNCSFVLFILHWHGFIMLVMVYVTYLGLKGVGGKYQTVNALCVAIFLLLFFILHKTHFYEEFEALTALRKVLSVCGFSYVALRMVEITRAVYEKRYPPPSLITCVNYLIPFHMMAAGPIQSYDNFMLQPLDMTSPDMASILEAVERIVFGLFKKFVLAYIINETFLTGFTSNGIYFFIEVQFFFLWLYLDFSAYSDIAVGVGRLLGVPTPENFNHPYLARNMTDFWERWHITLSQFIWRNVFIPLQLYLNRRNKAKRPLLAATLAFSVAFLLCGLWHGISVNFLIWGAIHAFGLIVANYYKYLLKKYLGKDGVKQYMESAILRNVMRIVTYEYVAFSLVFLFYP